MTQGPRKPGLRLPWSSHEEQPKETDAQLPPSPQTTDAEPMTATQAAVGGGDQVQAEPEPMVLDEEQNALLASLVQAMRDVAEREREASLSGLRTSVDEGVETLRARSAEGAEDLRRRSDEDIAGIHEWVRKEIERITAEGDRKTEARRQQLTQQLTDHEQRSQREIEGLHARVDEYERELAGFFAQLGEISDPAAFGTAAKRMPRPPTLASVAPAQTTTQAGTAPPEAEAEAEGGPTSPLTDGGSPQPASEATAEAEGLAPEPVVEEEHHENTAAGQTEVVEEHRHRLDALGIARNGAEAEQEESASQDDPLRARLAQLDAQIGERGATAAPQVATQPAPPAAGQEVATAIVVQGLGSFGAITSFKQALERVDGVRGISLSLGPTGEFVYRATHDAEFDLVGAIEQIERGPAQIDRQPDGSLRVTVQRTR
jgi:hypothetical protein